MTNRKKKRILILGAGGTITAEYVDDALKPGKINETIILENIPEIKRLANVEIVELFKTDSSNLQPENWIKMAKIIKNNSSNFDGFLIMHGTDTMHYSAIALSFLLQNIKKPIVLTGAQIPAHIIGSDARRNIIDSIRVIVDHKICEVSIVFNGKIFRGVRTKKNKEIELDAFSSVGFPILGIIESSIRYAKEYITCKTKNKFKYYSNLENKVYLQKLTPGFDPKIISYLIDKLKYKAIVLEGFGPGNVPIEKNSLIPEIKKASKKNVPIVVASQCDVGASWMYLYESGKTALANGAIPAYDMLSETALIKLMWILGNYKNAKISKIKKLFLQDISGEISSARVIKEKKVF